MPKSKLKIDPKVKQSDQGDNEAVISKKAPKKKSKQIKNKSKNVSGGESNAGYPRHAVIKSLKIPKAILEQNAGHACTDKESAGFCKVGYHGPYKVELSSSLKYGLLERPEQGKVTLTDIARQILRPKSANDEIEGLRKAVLHAPQIGDVYKHYRGENLPDEPFFTNTLNEVFKVPLNKTEEFKTVFIESLKSAKLLEEHGEKQRVVDISQGEGFKVDSSKDLQKLGRAANIQKGESCFVMMPFASPIGEYFKKIYEPAIEKVGLRAVRADDDMFTTGKIIDQIWDGIHSAKILVAELTGRNPNVFYELGLAHALQKPVVLVASNEKDVPFDVQHIRVIYYDVQDPFWGDKLISKLSENILSAITNPQEAVFKKFS